MLLITKIESYLNKFKQGRQTETKQGLCDLAYLSINEFDDDTKLEKAIRQFRKDYEGLNLLTKRFSFYNSNEFSNFATELNTFELELLNILTSFDGDFTISVLPHKKDINLISRLIHFRLNIFGLYGTNTTKDIEKPFSEVSLQSLGKINEYYKQGIDLLEIANLLGNLPKLDELIFRSATNEKSNIYIPNNYNKLVNIKELRGAYQYNDFLTRVFQMFLWTHGLYSGRIDGIVKEKTEDGYIDLVKLISQQKTHKDKSLDYKIYPSKSDDYYILKVVELLQQFPSETIEKKISISNVLKEENIVIDEKLFTDDSINKHFEDTKNDLKEGRRLNYKGKRIVNSLKVAVSDYFTEIKNDTSDLFNLITNIIKRLYKEIRTALTIFYHGLNFLFGSRTINSENIISDFDLNFDGVVVSNSQSTEELVQKHIDKCQYYTNSLKVSLGFTGIILRLFTGNWNIVNFFITLSEQFKIYKTTNAEYQELILQSKTP